MRCIEQEFELLKIEFGVPHVKLEISPAKVRANRPCRAFYNGLNNTIILPTNRMRPVPLFTLLHEFQHSVQYSQGRLIHYWDNFPSMWALEWESDLFALKEYKERYLEFGPVPVIDEEKRRESNFRTWKKVLKEGMGGSDGKEDEHS